MKKLNGLLRRFRICMHVLIAFVVASTIIFCFGGESYLDVKPFVVDLVYFLSFIAFFVYVNTFYSIRRFYSINGFKKVRKEACDLMFSSTNNVLAVCFLSLIVVFFDKMSIFLFTPLVILISIYILMSSLAVVSFQSLYVVVYTKDIAGRVVRVRKFESCFISNAGGRKSISKNGIHDVTDCKLLICNFKSDEDYFNSEYEFDSKKHPGLSYEAFKNMKETHHKLMEMIKKNS